MRMVVRFFSTLASFVALVGCTAPSKPALYSPRPYEQGTDPPLSKLARVGTGASQRDREDLCEGILRARSLEADLPRELAGTRYAMEYFSMSRLAPEAFLMVVAEPSNRRNWQALAKVAAYGDGEYASPYQYFEAAAKAEFPEVFFARCPDWNRLVFKANRAK